MEKVQRLFQEAKNYLSTADHLTYVTYNLLKDQKLVLPILQNLYNACLNVIAALIYYEKIYKKVNPFPLDADSRIKLFETELAKKYKLDNQNIKVIKELRTIINDHMKSSLEFARGDKLVICNEDYSKLDIIDSSKLKYYILNTKKLLGDVERCLNK